MNVESKSLRIMLVDSDIDTLEAMALLLPTLGHEVLTVTSGEAALMYASLFCPEVIMLELQLTDCEACNLVRNLRSSPHTHDAYIVAFTGYPSHWHQRQRREAGFDAYLEKPAFLEEIAALLEHAPTLRNIL